LKGHSDRASKKDEPTKTGMLVMRRTKGGGGETHSKADQPNETLKNKHPCWRKRKMARPRKKPPREKTKKGQKKEARGGGKVIRTAKGMVRTQVKKLSLRTTRNADFTRIGGHHSTSLSRSQQLIKKKRRDQSTTAYK